MKKRTFIQSAGIIFFILIAAPYFAFASTLTVYSDVFNPTILKGPLVICTGVPTSGVIIGNGGGNEQIYNFPGCQNICDLVAQIENVIYFFIAVVIWIVMPVLVAIGGIMIMFAGANPGLIETGKKTITGAVIGVVIVLCAYLIVGTFVGFLGIQGIGGFGASSCQIAAGSATTPSTNTTGN